MVSFKTTIYFDGTLSCNQVIGVSLPQPLRPPHPFTCFCTMQFVVSTHITPDKLLQSGDFVITTVELHLETVNKMPVLALLKQHYVDIMLL